MPTGARVRKPVDVRRIGEAVSYPGIDPRTWVSAARVDDDPDAIRWDAELGQIIDVTLTGGAVDQEGEVPCRVVQRLAGDLFGSSIPLEPGAEVAVLINEGTPDAGPVIVGQLQNAGGGRAPTTVHGLPIDGEALLSDADRVSPRDTEIKVSPYHRREQYTGDHTLAARRIVALPGEELHVLAEDAASIKLEVTGTGTIEIVSVGTIIVNSPDVRLGTNPGQSVACVGDLVMGSLHALSAAPGSPIAPNPAPVAGAGVPFVAQITSGRTGVTA